jgi:potassium-dependent mechanosensitive channel
MRHLLLCTCLLISGLHVHAQDAKEKKAPAKSHIELSLDTVMQKIDDMYMTLNSINSFQQEHFDTSNIRNQLSDINNTLDIIRNNLTGKMVREYKSILLDEYVLNDIQNQLQQWRTALFQYNNNLVKMNTETAAFSQDTLLKQLIADSNYREMYQNELFELSHKWAEARKSTDTNLHRINALQSAISKPWFETLDLLTQVSFIKKQIAGVLFSKEYPYIWESQGPSRHIGEMAAQSFKSERGLVSFFWRQNWRYYIYALLIGALFFYWTWNNYHQILHPRSKAPTSGPGDPTSGPGAAAPEAPAVGPKALAAGPKTLVAPEAHAAVEAVADPETMRKVNEERTKGLADLHLHYVRPNPILAALVVALNILPLFNFNAPTSFTQFGQFLLLIVVSMLFWLDWPRRHFMSWLYIAVLYIVVVGTGAALVPRQDARLWMLVLCAGSIVLIWYAIRRILPFMAYPKLIKAARWIFLVLNGLAILCNATGRLSLAKILSTSAVFGLVQIMLLIVFVDCILEGLKLQTLKTKLLERTDKVSNRINLFDNMSKGVYRLLMFVALLTWVIAFAINLNIYDPIYNMAVRFWDHIVKFGSVSFRMGNVLLFIFILYLSNTLQKYVGYLYGSGNEQQGQLTGRKGSRLVMIRLILIISGFLVAIIASGLPVDRITIVLGALGVGIGLGLQNIVNNLVSGIILIFEHPFQIGDYIELNGKKGIVRDIGIRSSRMVTEEGTEIIMPNGDLLSGEVVNWTQRNSRVRLEIPMTIEPGHSFEEVSTIIIDEIKAHPDLSSNEPPRVLLNTSSAASMSFTVIVYVENIQQIQTIKSEILRLLIKQLAEKNIKTA